MVFKYSFGSCVLFDSSCVVVQLFLLLFMISLVFPPTYMCKFGSENLRSTIEGFFLVWLSNYAYCKFLFLCLDVNVYLFIYFGETFFYVSNSIFVCY